MAAPGILLPHLPNTPRTSPSAGTVAFTSAATSTWTRLAKGAGPPSARRACRQRVPEAELEGSPVAPRAFPQCSANAAMEAGRTAVLRVKRKRSAEPAEALVLSCKRLRSSAVESTAQKTVPEDLERGPENNVFQLVATVRSQVLGGMEPVFEGILGRCRGEIVSLISARTCSRRLPSPTTSPTGGAGPGARSSRPAPFPGQPAAYPPRPPRFGSGEPAGGSLPGDF